MTETLSRADHAGDQRNIFLRISAHLARATEIQTALTLVAEDVAEVLPHTHFDICLIDSPEWAVSYEVGIKTRWSRKRSRIKCSPVRDLLCNRVGHMICSNAMKDPRQTFPGATSEPIFNHMLRSRVHVGMKVMGQLIGTLNISHSKIDFYNETTLRLAQHLADLLAPYFHALRLIERAQRDALERAEVQSREEGLRQGASRLTQALEQERQRIGMDLHDQTLADLTRMLRTITNDAEPLDRERLTESVTTCIRDLRLIIDEAVPSQLDLFGFCHAISEHLAKGARTGTYNISVTDNTDGAIDGIDPTVRTAVFRIAQEAANNAMTHSNATHISVLVDRTPEEGFRIVVRDNGVGICEQIPKRKSGLLHMETRARLILAQLEITHNIGTSVALTLPVERTG